MKEKHISRHKADLTRLYKMNGKTKSSISDLAKQGLAGSSPMVSERPPAANRCSFLYLNFAECLKLGT